MTMAHDVLVQQQRLLAIASRTASD